MLDFSILKPEGILLLKPRAPLNTADFSGLAALVDAYLSDQYQMTTVHSRARPAWTPTPC